MLANTAGGSPPAQHAESPPPYGAQIPADAGYAQQIQIPAAAAGDYAAHFQNQQHQPASSPPGSTGSGASSGGLALAAQGSSSSSTAAASSSAAQGGLDALAAGVGALGLGGHHAHLQHQNHQHPAGVSAAATASLAALALHHQQQFYGGGGGGNGNGMGAGGMHLQHQLAAYQAQQLGNPYVYLQQSEEISTIFVVGFPDDMHEREFQNMFLFCPGFEAATLKIPSHDDPSGKKQIIGFAKFRTRREALQAKDKLTGRKVDPNKNCMLKVEMAKKNLHIKKAGVGAQMMQAPNGGGGAGGYYHDPFAQNFYPKNNVFYNSFPPLQQAKRANGSDSPSGQQQHQQHMNGGAANGNHHQQFNHSNGQQQPMDPFLNIPPHLPSDLLDLEPQQPQSSSQQSPTSSQPGGQTQQQQAQFYRDQERLMASSPFTNSSSTASSNHGDKFMHQQSQQTLFTSSNSQGTTSPANSETSGTPTNTLCIANLPVSMTEPELVEIFSASAGYRRLAIRQNGYMISCYVEYDSAENAAKAHSDIAKQMTGVKVVFSRFPPDSLNLLRNEITFDINVSEERAAQHA